MVAVFFRLHLPLIIFLLLILCLFLIEADGKATTISLNLLVFEVDLPVKNMVVARAVVIVGAFASLASYPLLDFTQFFKPILEMEVHFDPEGIRQRVNLFSDSELARLNVVRDYEPFQVRYYDVLDWDLNVNIKEAGAVFRAEGETIYAKGWTIFYVTKIGHFHKYRIARAQGHLDITVQRLGKQDLKFKSIFEQLASANDFIRPSLFRLFAERKMIISPKFRQTLVDFEKSTYTEFHHTLIAVTVIYAFPIPSYSDTLYLFDLEGVGRVPIGYCIYS